MGRILLVTRLAVRDLRRRRGEAALLLLAITAATTTLTLGLVLRDAAADPYQHTRQATHGPDVVASALEPGGSTDLEELSGADEVTDHSGPFPVAPAELEVAGRTADVQAVGRDADTAAVDQPHLTRGGWVSDGGVVVEAAFAGALEVGVGDRITVDGRPFTVVGTAITAAMPPYPGSTCLVSVGCVRGAAPEGAPLPPGILHTPGLVWLTRTDLLALAEPADVTHVLNLRLADPNTAQAFVDAYVQRASTGADGLPTPPPLGLMSWRDILGEATELAADSQILLMIGAWLLGLLAVASISVLVGGRMADQTRRVGLLKATGGTPGTVAAVLLAEYLLVAVVAAAAGLVVGALTAPHLTESSAGLVGTAGTPPVGVATIALVTAVALGVAIAATAVPTLRAARTSTVTALADAAHPPRRTGWLVTMSRRLPVPLLLAMRVAARRPRRVVLNMVSVAVTVSGVFVILVLNTFLTDNPSVGGYSGPQVELLRQVLSVWLVILLCLAAVNATVIAWATVLDNRHTSALARALGATPRAMSTALAATQVLPALVGALVGIFPGGLALFTAIITITGGDGDRATLPPLWQMITVILATVLAVTALTAIPARLGSRHQVTRTL